MHKRRGLYTDSAAIRSSTRRRRRGTNRTVVQESYVLAHTHSAAMLELTTALAPAPAAAAAVAVADGPSSSRRHAAPAATRLAHHSRLSSVFIGCMRNYTCCDLPPIGSRAVNRVSFALPKTNYGRHNRQQSGNIFFNLTPFRFQSYSNSHSQVLVPFFPSSTGYFHSQPLPVPYSYLIASGAVISSIASNK